MFSRDFFYAEQKLLNSRLLVISHPHDLAESPSKVVVEVGNLVLNSYRLMPSRTVLQSSDVAIGLIQVYVSVVHSVVIRELQFNLKQSNFNYSGFVPHDQIIPIAQMILLLHLLSTDNHALLPLIVIGLLRSWRGDSDGGVVLLVAPACILHIRVLDLLQVSVSKEGGSLLGSDGLRSHVFQLCLGRRLDLFLDFGARLDVPLEKGLVLVKNGAKIGDDIMVPISL